MINNTDFIVSLIGFVASLYFLAAMYYVNAKYDFKRGFKLMGIGFLLLVPMLAITI